MGLSSKQVSSDHLEFNWTQNLLTTNTIQQTSNQRSTPMKRSLQTQPPDPLNCPRCDSTNTKFCYYNNYNKTQPRHYCRTCKRHWTKGGTLRNVPVGGGRKNKKIKRSTTTVTTAAATNATPATVDRGNDQKYIFPDDKGLFFKPNDREFDDQVSWDNFNMHQNLGFSVHSNLTLVDTITNPNPITSSSFSPLFNNSATVSQPWMQVINPTASSFLEPNNYWSWNENDPMVSKPFSDDPQMK